ncbi:hypothetical protein [Pinibacter aurantiacus]|uniref:Uncharacterized protein n=1 Tax=Pinibacter aurantiacus TaxID=2851599 RepID=A0A9E2S5U6_9BACT|nr:hypothetical protein [Pinibacter aurantiacus]MBV4357203.1 hypothetical protein [Pinibacter aurantiacus]
MLNPDTRKLCALILLTLLCRYGYAQQVDIDGLKDVFKAKPVKFSGGVSASTMFYNGNGGTGRAPFTWFLQGNANANILGKINLPFSFNFTNAGRGFSYPTLPNRLSLHPTFRWITGHIGDVAMSFSPYTLNGYQFRGAGVDLAFKGPWKVSAMTGRLQKAVNYDSSNLNSLPTYQRMGYGVKANYEKSWYKGGIAAFYANDNVISLYNKPDSLAIYPQQNLAISYEVGVKPAKGLEINAVYASSALTADKRDIKGNDLGKGWMKKVMNGNSTTSLYHAFKTQVNYSFLKSTVGVGFERVDPGYKTLGAYYFNNDLENITINFGQSLLKDKANLALSLGSQRDNLDGGKAGTTQRLVGSINVNYAPVERMQTSLMYSNFQTHMNMRPQFDYINNVSPIVNFDTLNYVQLSQNAAVNVNYITKKTEQQNQALNVNINFQDASDQQGGVVTKGNSSQFYNLATAYNVLFLEKGLNVTLAYNVSYNTIARNNFLTQGPTLSANAKLFDKKVTVGFSSSYNTSASQGTKQNDVLSLRVNAAYTLLKKHRLNCSLINQYRNVINKGSTHDLTGTLGYNYAF